MHLDASKELLGRTRLTLYAVLYNILQIYFIYVGDISPRFLVKHTPTFKISSKLCSILKLREKYEQINT